MKRTITVLGLLCVTALPASAQQLTLAMSDGRVTLDAANVPARQILSEWARIGGTNVVGADKITGAPLTLKLVDMPERQALDIILRNVAGFMAAPRRLPAPGQSAYDRILIMATSAGAAAAANANARPGTPAANAMNGTQRRIPGRPPNLPPNPGDDQPEVEEPDSADVGVAQQPVFTFPGAQPGQPGGANQPVFVPIQNGQFGAQTPGSPPVINLAPGANGPTIYNFVPNSQGAPTTPPTQTTPFGAIGSPTPGMIQQPPPPAPGQPVRPPG